MYFFTIVRFFYQFYTVKEQKVFL